MKSIALLALSLALPAVASADTPHPHDHAAMQAGHAAPPPATRERVSFPPKLKEETLVNMRDHLLALQEITAHLADRQFDAAAEVAETRLGMTSLQRHGAHEVAQYMPAGMRQVGHGMHRAASQFAVAAKDASVTHDTGAALRALATLQSSCIACHAGYQLK